MSQLALESSLLGKRHRRIWRIALWLITDPQEFTFHDSSRPRNYQKSVPGQPRRLYLCGGRFTSKSAVPIATSALICCPAIVYFVSTAPLVWHRVHPLLVILLACTLFLALSNFAWALLCDPGTLPRNVHLPSQVESQNPIVQIPREYANVILLPHYSGLGVSTRFCPVCQIWRPPRAAHCYKCNLCCTTQDHHCVWLGNCVGARNYSYFLWFLVSTVATCGLFGILLLLALQLGPNLFVQEIKDHPATLFVAGYVLTAVLQPLLLLILHVWLTFNNLTTREFLNNVYFLDQPYMNPFNTGNVFKNAFIFWCGRVRGVQLVKNRGEYLDGHAHFLSVSAINAVDGT